MLFLRTNLLQYSALISSNAFLLLMYVYWLWLLIVNQKSFPHALEFNKRKFQTVPELDLNMAGFRVGLLSGPAEWSNDLDPLIKLIIVCQWANPICDSRKYRKNGKRKRKRFTPLERINELNRLLHDFICLRFGFYEPYFFCHKWDFK